MISFADNVPEFQRGLSDLAMNQMPFAIAMALNDTAEEVDDAWKVQIQRRIDRPTPFTQRGTFRRRATKRKLTATVGVKDIQAGYLRWQVAGGVQRPRGRGIAIPVGQRRNKYGNMPRGRIRQLLAKDTNFAGEVQGVAGIWQRLSARQGGGLRLLVGFRDQAEYQPVLDLERAGAGRARSAFPPALGARLRHAIATSR